MNPLQSLACPNCGYPLPEGAAPGSMVRCPACASTFNLPASLTPEPDLGDLLIAADFHGPTILGWKVFPWEKPATFGEYQGLAEWLVTLIPEPNHLSYYLISTHGPLDDFDACVTLRFLKGDEKNYYAGFTLRAGEDGAYQVVIDSGQRYRVGWINKSEWGGVLVPWGEHSALRAGLGERNTLRVLLRGNQMRVYFNGVLAVSLHDDRFKSGKIRVIASSWDQEMLLAVSNLQVREVRT